MGNDGAVWAAVAVLAPTLGLLVALWPKACLLAFVALAVLTAAVLSRELALGAILVSAFVMIGVSDATSLPSQAALLTKALVALFALTVLLDLDHDNRLRVPRPLLMLASVLTVSAVFGAGTRFLAFQALASYLIAPIAYVAIIHSRLTIESLRRLFILVVGLALVQLPLVIIESRFTTNVDRIGGTYGLYGGTSTLAVMMAIAWTIAVAALLGRRRIWLLPIGVAISAVLIITSARAGFFFAAMGTICVGITKAIANPKRGLAALPVYVAVGVTALAVLFGGYLYFGHLLPGGRTESGYAIMLLKDPTAILNYLFSVGAGGQAGRLGGLRLALAQNHSVSSLLIGQGLGVLSQSALLGQGFTSSSAMGPSFDWATSATRWLLEAGLLGILLYLVLIGTAVSNVVTSWTAHRSELGIAIAAATVGSAAIYTAAALYASAWNLDSMAIVCWCLLGMVAKWGALRNASLEEVPGPSEANRHQQGVPTESATGLPRAGR